MPLVAFGLLRFLFTETASHVDSLGAGEDGVRHDAAAVAQGKMMQALLDSLGTGALGKSELALVPLLFMVYSAVFGLLSELVLGGRAFGRYLNGVICMLGGTIGLIAYTRLVGSFSGNHFGLSIVVVVLGSTLLLLATAFIKSWVLGKADDFISGAWEVRALRPSREVAHAPSARDRLSAVANKRGC